VARGALHHEAANEAQPDASLPLVSILIPAGDDATQRSWKPPCAARWLSTTAAAKSSSATTAPAQPPPAGALLKRHPQLRYNRAPALDAADNLDHCLTLAVGEYIAVAPAGDLLHTEKSAA
jgi:hypothetical protein